MERRRGQDEKEERRSAVSAKEGEAFSSLISIWRKSSTWRRFFVRRKGTVKVFLFFLSYSPLPSLPSSSQSQCSLSFHASLTSLSVWVLSSFCCLPTINMLCLNWDEGKKREKKEKTTSTMWLESIHGCKSYDPLSSSKSKHFLCYDSMWVCIFLAPFHFSS